MTDLFHRERELCLLFEERNESEHVSIRYPIDNSAVTIFVAHGNNYRDVEKERKTLNRLGKNFKLDFIGYLNECVVLRYFDHDGPLTEYNFPMVCFNVDNYHSPEFLNYLSDY